jgi:hypothetical protein
MRLLTILYRFVFSKLRMLSLRFHYLPPYLLLQLLFPLVVLLVLEIGGATLGTFLLSWCHHVHHRKKRSQQALITHVESPSSQIKISSPKEVANLQTSLDINYLYWSNACNSFDHLANSMFVPAINVWAYSMFHSSNISLIDAQLVSNYACNLWRVVYIFCAIGHILWSWACTWQDYKYLI